MKPRQTPQDTHQSSLTDLKRKDQALYECTRTMSHVRMIGFLLTQLPHQDSMDIPNFKVNEALGMLLEDLAAHGLGIAEEGLERAENLISA